MKFACVICDLDGTLADTLEDIARSMNRALTHHGFPARRVEEYRDMVGNGIARLARRSLPDLAPDDPIAEQVAAYAAQCYALEPAVHSKPYPGILALLGELKRLKVALAVLSNKPDPITQLVVGKLFPPGAFNLVLGETPGFPRKPDPASTWDILMTLGATPRETIFMGDSEIDMETARAAECCPLGVCWGYRSRRVLEKAGARRIIERPEELSALIRETRI